MNRSSSFLLATLIAASTTAQVSIGNRAGIGSSHTVSDDADVQKLLETDNNPLLGLGVAMVVEVKIKPFIALQSEFGLTQKGHQIKEPKQDGYSRLRTNYGEAQLLAKGIIGKGPAKLNILAGASFGRGMVGVQRNANNALDTTTSISFLDQNSKLVDFGPGADELNRVEWSLIGGLGASFDLGTSRVFIEGRYVNGLTSIYNDSKSGTTAPGVFNRTLLLQFGYLVQLNDPKKDTSAKPEAPQY